MFAGKNTYTSNYRRPVCWVVVGIILFVFDANAQHQAEQPDSATQSRVEVNEGQEAVDGRHIERLGEVSADEWEMELALPATAAGNVDFSVLGTEQHQRLQQLLSSLASNPENAGTLAQLNTLLRDVLDQAGSLTEAGSFERSVELLAVIRAIDPNLNGLKSAQQRTLALSQVGPLQREAAVALESQRYVSPKNNNALYFFKQILQRDPQNNQAQLSLEQLQQTLLQRALEYATELDFEMADEWLASAVTVREQQERVVDTRARVAEIRVERAMELEASAIDNMDSGDFELAEFKIIDLIALGGQEQRVKLLQTRLVETRYYSGFVPGQVFTDPFLTSKASGPEMVIIAAGSFLMGSAEQSAIANANEQPQHRVGIKRGFALGVREVSVAEFRLFVERSGYQTAADHAGRSTIYDDVSGRFNSRSRVNWEKDFEGKKAASNLPVLHVNWHDANVYVKWLTRETGKKYRLPTEAEYEFVARAGNKGSYWWGEGSPRNVVENLTGGRDSSPGNRNWTTAFKRYGDAFWGPAPTGSFMDIEHAHPMGVHDIAGNVSEWMADCWHQNFIHAPTDGSAWVNPGCKRRVVKGGYWASAPAKSRAAYRISAKPETFGPVVGIRVARDL